MSGIRANVDCAARIVSRLEPRLQALAADTGQPVFLIGQSRGGTLARSLAVRNPEIVSGLVMLGSPVCDPLAVSAPVLRTVRWMAWLGDRGLPGVFSRRLRGGPVLRGLPRGPDGSAAVARRGGRGAFAQRRNRRLASLP